MLTENQIEIEAKENQLKKILSGLSLHIYLDIGLIIALFFVGYTIKSLSNVNGPDPRQEKLALAIMVIVTVVLSILAYISSQLLLKRVEKISLEIYKDLNNAHKKIDDDLRKSSLKLTRMTNNLYNTIGIATTYLTNTIEGDHEIKDYAYNESLEVIKSAKKSIWIIGDYSPARDRLVPTEVRLSYLQQIENVIQEKIEAKKGAFDYRRIMQRNESLFNQIRDSHGRITKKEQIAGDEQAFDHCRRVLKLLSGSHNSLVEISLIVTPVAPSLPSILLVDEKHLLFTIPKKLRGDRVLTEGVIHFIDSRRGTPMIQSFKSIFQSVFEDDDKHSIISIDDNLF